MFTYADFANSMVHLRSYLVPTRSFFLPLFLIAFSSLGSCFTVTHASGDGSDLNDMFIMMM